MSVLPEGVKPPEIRNIVFDEDVWHPLDHVIGSPRCFTFQDGKKLKALRRHRAYGWDFKWLPAIRRRTACVVGIHRHTEGWRRWSRDDPWVSAGFHCMDGSASLRSSTEQSDRVLSGKLQVRVLPRARKSPWSNGHDTALRRPGRRFDSCRGHHCIHCEVDSRHPYM